MFPPRYLVRFDDICPTMDWAVWAEIESCLRAHGIRPIVAIVPNNRDRKLAADLPRRDFWERVREWRDLGWSIGLHGYEHRRLTADGGIVDINIKSEFAGVPYETQLANLTSAMSLFRSEGITPDVWVAPWHSFDQNTLKALRAIGIDRVSDGFALRASHDRDGMLWVPQQLWRFRRVPCGTWTVCNHHNHWNRRQLDVFLQDIARFAPRITSLAAVSAQTRASTGWVDRLSASTFHRIVRFRQIFTNRPVNPEAEAARYLE
jgi:predicted deacetylase